MTFIYECISDLCGTQATWESTLLANYFGLYNGGTGGVIWCTVAVWLFMLCMIASMAEMASMAPTAAGDGIESICGTTVLTGAQANITGSVSSLQRAFRNRYPTSSAGAAVWDGSQASRHALSS